MNKSLVLLSNLIFEQKKNVYLGGSGGCGKTTMLKEIYKMALEQNINVELTSTTGVSAFNVGGITIHRWSGCRTGVDPVDVLLENIYKYKFADEWKSIQLLIIDEISMMG